MTFLEALANEKRWHRRALIINLYHKSHVLKKKKWTMRASAKKLNISLGQVSEAVKLAQALIENPSLKSLRRDEALRSIKK